MKQYRSLFGNRNFMLFWIGGAISNIGDFFNSIALVKILSEDPAHLGFYMALIMVAKVAPGLLLGPVAGVVADRLDRRTILVVTDLLRAGLVAGLVFTTNPLMIVALCFLSASVAAFFNPAHDAMLPNLVGADELVSAGSLSFMTQRMAQMLGTGLGAAMLMVTGPHAVFYIDAASFVVSAVLNGLLVVPKRVPAGAAAEGSAKVEEASQWQKFTGDVRAAIGFLKDAPVVRRLLAAFGLLNIGDSGGNVLLISFFTITLGLPAEQYGFMLSLLAGAGVAGALLIGGFGKRIHWRHLISYGSIHIWVFYFAAIAIHRVLPSAISIILVGLGSGAVNVGAQASFGTQVPDWVRGRVFSAWGMIQSLIYIVGVTAAGALSDRFGPAPVLMGYTLTYLFGGLYAMWAFRGLGAAEAAGAEPGLAPADGAAADEPAS